MKLNGKWKLYAIENSGRVNTPEELSKYSAISAEVPGNVELDLINAGLLPEDIYKGRALCRNRAGKSAYLPAPL